MPPPRLPIGLIVGISLIDSYEGRVVHSGQVLGTTRRHAGKTMESMAINEQPYCVV